MMASSTSMREIDERFLKCSICLDQLKRPKMLPCGHSYCRDCLHQSVTRGSVRIKCPTCRRYSPLPPIGVDGFPNDFNSQNIIEFVEAQHSAKRTDRRERGDKNQSKRCRNCPGKLMAVSCSTCDSLSLCVQCGITLHRNHSLKGMRSLTRERMASLMLYQDMIYGKQDAIHNAKEDIQEMADHYDSVVERFEELTTAAPGVLDAGRDRANTECVLDIYERIDSLMGEIEAEYPISRVLSDIILAEPPPAARDGKVFVDIPGREESMVDIKAGLTREGWSITSITGNDEGTIVVTGEASPYHSHITMIDITGRLIEQKTPPCRPVSGSRYCDFLAGSKVATACFDDEIGVYDIMAGTYRKRYISDEIGSCTSDWLVSSIAADRVKDVFYVGGRNSRTVHVFSGDLQHQFTFRLPRTIKWPRDMAVHGDRLLVCDWKGEKALAVTVDGSGCKLEYEFEKPSGEDQQPHSVCTDGNGFIYMVWETASSATLVQYSRDGRRLLMRPVNWLHDQLFIAAVRIEEGEKLVMPTGKGQLIVYGLVETDS